MLLPIEGQKVEGIGPSPLEEGIRDREKEPAGASDWAAITTSFGHDIDTSLKKLKSLDGGDMRAKLAGLRDESINTEGMIMSHDLIKISVGR